MIAASRPIGTIMMIDSGRTRLSYCAASTRKTRKIESGKHQNAGIAGKDFLIRQLGPLEADALGQSLARRCVRRLPWPGPKKSPERRRR